jgi:hypothetical protein
MKQPNEQAITFLGEVIEVKSKKTASLDVTYRVVLQTNDMSVLSLGTLDGDTVVNVKVEIDG